VDREARIGRQPAEISTNSHGERQSEFGSSTLKLRNARPGILFPLGLMHWTAPSENDTDNAALEKRLWEAADQFRANSGLKSQEYSAIFLDLIFPRNAA
jgi:hypothetical protein